MLINLVLGLFAVYLLIGLVVMFGLLAFLGVVLCKTYQQRKEEVFDDFTV